MAERQGEDDDDEPVFQHKMKFPVVSFECDPASRVEFNCVSPSRSMFRLHVPTISMEHK